MIDTATNAITSTFSTNITPSRPFGITFTPDGAFAYMANGIAANSIVVDTAAQTVVANIPTVGIGFDTAITPNGATVYQTSTGGNAVDVIDTASNTVIATVQVPTPSGIALTPDGDFAYVASSAGSAVFVIDTVTNALVAGIGVFGGPYDVVITRVIQVPPVVASDNASVTFDEGQTATNTGTATDVNREFVTLSASVGSVVNNGNGTWSWSFDTSEGPAESQTVTITGDDGEGGVDMTSFDLVVENVAPTIDSVSNDGPIFTGGSATISGNTSPDATGVGSGNPSVRAERDGGNDGRVYHIAFTATGSSGSCTGTVTVGVPKSKGKGDPVDQGPLYDSTQP